MKKIKGRTYLFFRSFVITSVIIYCFVALVLGMGYCHEKMERARTGRSAMLFTQNEMGAFCTTEG